MRQFFNALLFFFLVLVSGTVIYAMPAPTQPPHYSVTDSGAVMYAQGYGDSSAVDGADATSFTILGTWYAKDNASVYYAGKKWSDPDVSSFKLLTASGTTLDFDGNGWNYYDGDLYTEDRSHTYYGNTVLDGVIPSTLTIFAGEGYQCSLNNHYAGTAEQLFYMGKVVEGVTGKGIQVLDCDTAKNAQNVVFQGQTIQGADPATFKSLGEERDPYDQNLLNGMVGDFFARYTYAEDDHFAYRDGKKYYEKYGAFPDVPRSNYAASVGKLKMLGVLNGYADGSFHPERSINRAEFLKMLFVLHPKVVGTMNTYKNLTACVDDTTGGYAKRFSDVPTNAWFAPYVCGAVSEGIVKGYPDRTFHPESTITYAEALKMITHLFMQSLVDQAGDTWSLSKYISDARDTLVAQFKQMSVDSTNGATWYAPYLSDAKSYNFALAELAPHTPLTRLDAAELIMRYVEKMQNVNGTALYRM